MAESDQPAAPEPHTEPPAERAQPAPHVSKPKPKGKQAVVLIHGIGEQRPMDTLRGFVRAVWETHADVRYPGRYTGVWSKPDKRSGNYELRRLTTGQNKNRVRTDFFEFYWAHLMEGNALNHVTAWARMLLLRNPRTIPRHLRPLWWLLVVCVVATVVLIAWGFSVENASLLGLSPALASLLSAAVSGLIGSVVVFWIGDAARYLNAAPPNIKSRAAIRQAGVDLLRTLHERDEYDRIIIVGHSLGSVIGYDILTHAWPEFNEQHNHSDCPDRGAMRDFERYLAPRTDDNARPLPPQDLTGADPLDPQRCREFQTKTREALRSTGSRWLVTDFITLGSPLAHAAALLAKSPEDLAEKVAARELPACPPVLEDPHRNTAAKDRRFSWRLKYKSKTDGRGRSVFVPHHAAVFCTTRWTNLYFPRRWLLWGDFVAGPVAPFLGPAIEDIPVRTSRWLGLFSHTTYWWMPKRAGTEPPSHIATLRDAVNLLDIPPGQGESEPAGPVDRP